MRHTLLSRFQGGFLGAALGELLADQWKTHPSDVKAYARTWAEVNFEGAESVRAVSSAPDWGRLAIAQMRCLTSSSSVLAEPLSESFSQSLAEPPVSSAGLAIALLPLAFFYHEDINLFERQVQQTLTQWQIPREMGMGVIAIGHAISLILREQFQPLDLIPQILAEMNDPTIALVDSLTQVQGWLVEASFASQFSAHRLSLVNSLSLIPSVSPLPVSLETIPIALALYAFLSTPEDFRLSLLRVAQFPGQIAHSLTCSLTAALSGTHNGKGSLPQDWRRLFHNSLKRQSPLSLLWDVRSESELLECVDSFVSAWSGIHNPMCRDPRSKALIAVAIPRIIRPI